MREREKTAGTSRHRRRGRRTQKERRYRRTKEKDNPFDSRILLGCQHREKEAEIRGFNSGLKKTHSKTENLAES